MRLKQKCKVQFFSILNYVLEQLLSDEEILLAYDESFCVAKFAPSLTQKVRESLFKIVFNQKLLAFLSSRIEKITNTVQLKSASSLSVFGVQRYGNQSPGDDLLSPAKQFFKEGSRARVPNPKKPDSSSASS